MIRAASALLALLAVAALGGCQRRADDAPIEASVIGGPLRVADPNRGPLPMPAAVLLEATAQGLVRFDAAGQIEPALAQRWIVADEGRSFIFRLRPLRWGDGRRLDAEDVARRLRAMLAPRSRNPLKPLLGAIDEIVAVTPEVIDIRLVAPRPDLLPLLAQPEMAILSGETGSGPFVIARRSDGALLLRPLPDPDADPDADPAAEPAPPRPERDVRLHGERAGKAIARFAAGRAELVSGGTFADLAIARAATLRAGALRFDPVAGLFGLAIARGDGFLDDAENRRALAMALDRDRIVAAFDIPGWRATATLVPAGLPDLGTPAAPDWIAMPFAARRAAAAAQIARWGAAHGAPAPLRVALPEGPGAQLLFALIRIDLRAIGIDAVRALPDEPAELTLVDAVAPADMAGWYLGRFACARRGPCSPDSDGALEAARTAPSAAERSASLADADRQLTEIAPFIPIAQPVRWSLVARALDLWRESPRGRHPLGALRSAPRR